jgi:hypothetical protein
MRASQKLILLSTVLFFTSLHIYSQETSSPYKLTLNGFVRADAIFDSRQVVEAREGFLLFFPKKPEYDKNGRDINAHPSFNQYAMTTRLTAKATGPDVLGSKIFALIEADFTGASNIENNSLRLRHGYISMQWTKTRLMLGQYWHPLDLPEMIPNVLSLNTGAPFHSFSRQPQLRIDYKTGNINLVAVAAAQRDYVNSGPAGSTSIYLRNSVIPNLHAQIQFKKNGIFAGAGVDYKLLTPGLVTDSLYTGNVTLNCISYTAFLSISRDQFSVKTQYVYGQALNDHLMLGGFALADTDPETEQRSYTALNHHFVWMNASYTIGKWQPSVFAGYTLNAGSDRLATAQIYARGADIAYIYRFAPMITFTTGKFSLIGEVEYTAAAYGENTEKFKVINTKETGNYRIGLGAVYSF